MINTCNVGSSCNAGFTYTVEILRAGQVIESEVVHNLIPTEGLNHILNVAFKSGSQVATWYVGLFANNYTPIAGDTMSSFPGTAGESSAYTSATRIELVLGTVASGSVDNSASKAEFTMNGSATIYGGFITSSNTKAGTTGTLVSAAKFSSPKTLVADDVLRISAGFDITSS